MSTETFEISIPPDDDGYILLQCEHCGSFFKATASDIKNDDVLNIHCPSCGLISDNYYTEDVIELAHTKALNAANNMIYDMLKKLERGNSSRNSLRIEVGKKPDEEYESPIRSITDNLEIKNFSCCKRNAKINPLLKMSACYCPFCGVMCFEDEQN